MADRIRFHLDEHVDPHIAAAMQRHGIDVTTTVDAGLRTASDDQQFEYARAERRVIVTDDPDFIRQATQTADHPGIIVCPRRWLSVRESIRGLILIYEVLTPDDMTNHIEYL